jgi:hypothetical protein
VATTSSSCSWVCPCSSSVDVETTDALDLEQLQTGLVAAFGQARFAHQRQQLGVHLLQRVRVHLEQHLAGTHLVARRYQYLLDVPVQHGANGYRRAGGARDLANHAHIVGEGSGGHRRDLDPGALLRLRRHDHLLVGRGGQEEECRDQG